MMLTTNDRKPTKREQNEAKMRQAVKLLKQMNVVLPTDFNFAGPHALGVLQGAIQSSNAAEDKLKEEAERAERANQIANESLRGYPKRRNGFSADLQPNDANARMPTVEEDNPLAYSEHPHMSRHRANALANQSIRGQALRK